jgi:hypothetical protein
MATVDWAAIENPNSARNKPEFENANVSFECEWIDDKDQPVKKDGSFEKKKRVIVLINYPGRDVTPLRWDHLNSRQKAEFQSRYDQWEKGEAITVKGFPLINWSVMPRMTCELFNRAGFQTVEQVAAIHGNENKELPTELKQWPKKAKIFIESAESTQAQVAALTERLEKAEHLLKQYEDKMEMMVRNAAVGSPVLNGASH